MLRNHSQGQELLSRSGGRGFLCLPFFIVRVSQECEGFSLTLFGLMCPLLCILQDEVHP